jgi:hypothetical protein
MMTVSSILLMNYVGLSQQLMMLCLETMIPINISISDIYYVDFKHKRVLENKVFVFEKLDLLREGLIDFQRLIRRGQVQLVSSRSEVPCQAPTEPASELSKRGSWVWPSRAKMHQTASYGLLA